MLKINRKDFEQYKEKLNPRRNCCSECICNARNLQETFHTRRKSFLENCAEYLESLINRKIFFDSCLKLRKIFEDFCVTDNVNRLQVE